MNWIDVNHRIPTPFVRVWVMTDTGRQTTGYVNNAGEWTINCPKVQASGAVVVKWRES
jgi:hypothetical protein